MAKEDETPRGRPHRSRKLWRAPQTWYLANARLLHRRRHQRCNTQSYLQEKRVEEEYTPTKEASIRAHTLKGTSIPEYKVRPIVIGGRIQIYGYLLANTSLGLLIRLPRIEISPLSSLKYTLHRLKTRLGTAKPTERIGRLPREPLAINETSKVLLHAPEILLIVLWTRTGTPPLAIPWRTTSPWYTPGTQRLLRMRSVLHILSITLRISHTVLLLPPSSANRRRTIRLPTLVNPGRTPGPIWSLHSRVYT